MVVAAEVVVEVVGEGVVTEWLEKRKGKERKESGLEGNP